MAPLSSEPNGALDGAPRADEDADLGHLIDTSMGADRPVVVTKIGTDLGVGTREKLLRGLWGELGAEALAEAKRQAACAQTFFGRAAQTVAEGGDGARFKRLGNNLMDAAVAGSSALDGVVAVTRGLLDTLAVVLVGTPWPVVMTVIIVTDWRLASPRVAILTAAAIAFLGDWEIAMETMTLVGAAVVIGIPAGMWFGKSKRPQRGRASA